MQTYKSFLVVLLIVMLAFPACTNDNKKEHPIGETPTTKTELNEKDNSAKATTQKEVNEIVESTELKNEVATVDQPPVKQTKDNAETKSPKPRTVKPTSNNFVQKEFDAIKLVGIEYELPNNKNLVDAMVKDAWTNFLQQDFYSQLDFADDKIYVVYKDYSKTGFKAFFGYAVKNFNNIPDNTSSYATPKGNYGVFKMKGAEGASYANAWVAAEAANSSRSFQADMEVYEFDWESGETKNGELRLHLK